MGRGGSNPGGPGPAPGPALWPARASEIRRLDSLKLRETNPRSHTLEQIEQISNSMKRWGWTIPVLIDEDGVILAGHGRVRAARLMGYGEAPVVVASGWTEEEKRAYVIADNQIATNSEWDRRRLQSELRSLVAADFDMGLIGITDADLSKLVLDPARAEPGEPEEVTMVKCPTCGRHSRKTEGKE